MDEREQAEDFWKGVNDSLRARIADLTADRDRLRVECEAARASLATVTGEREAARDEATRLGRCSQFNWECFRKEQAARVKAAGEADSLRARVAELERERDEEWRLNEKLLSDRSTDGVTIANLETALHTATARVERLENALSELRVGMAHIAEVCDWKDLRGEIHRLLDETRESSNA